MLTMTAGVLAVAALTAGMGRLASPDTSLASASVPPPASPPAPLVAAPAPEGLPTLSYWSAAEGFPADPDPASTAAVTQALTPDRKLAVYDAPGGKPLAFLPQDMSGLPVTVPIVARRADWVAVLLPTLNRTIGWLPPKGWSPSALHDQIVVHVAAHRLVWLRDGVEQAGFSVATGAADTPTPLGRTYVMGTTRTSGKVYAGVDALVLGAIPENKGALADELKDGHTAIHGWYKASAFGHSVSNGCVRLSAANQRRLLDNIEPGTAVHILAS
jgi:lipoprotein-anchoring transpeptidase ErfK/SrfK